MTMVEQKKERKKEDELVYCRDAGQDALVKLLTQRDNGAVHRRKHHHAE